MTWVTMQIVLILDQREQFDRSRQVGGHAVGREQSRDEYVDRLRRKGTDVEVRHLEGTRPLLAYVLRTLHRLVLDKYSALQDQAWDRCAYESHASPSRLLAQVCIPCLSSKWPAVVDGCSEHHGKQHRT